MTHLLTTYGFWLAVVSLLCLAAERIAPWRTQQSFARRELGQDVLWWLLNGYALAYILGPSLLMVFGAIDRGYAAVAGQVPSSSKLLGGLPLWVQIPALLIVADFIEWCVHNALHRIPALWRIHRVHHSIKFMDWVGNFRFSWIEIVIYKTIKYLPLAFLGADWRAVLTVAVISTTIGNLNHANLAISWGPLRYVLNSPRMHIWHHEKRLRTAAGVNFGIVLSCWDWIFGTAYMPAGRGQPEELGFRGEERVSHAWLARLIVPWRG